MDYSPRTRTIDAYMADLDKGKVSLEVPIQRKQNQWNVKQKNKLIMTMIYEYMPIPAIHVEQKEDGKLYVIDGLQRLSTIQSFIKNEWKLDKNLPDFVDETTSERVVLAKKRFKDLPMDIRMRILQTEIVQTKYVGYTDKQIADIFAALNNGTPLSEDQKMKATIPTNILNVMDDIINNSFFEKTALTKRQKVKGEDISILLQTAMLLTDFDYKNFSVKELQRYVEVCEFETIDQIQKAVLQLEVVFEEKQKYMKKVILPMVIAGACITDDFDEYAVKLQQFVTEYRENEEFMQYCIGATSSKEKIEGRWNYFKENLI